MGVLSQGRDRRWSVVGSLGVLSVLGVGLVRRWLCYVMAVLVDGHFMCWLLNVMAVLSDLSVHSCNLGGKCYILYK